MKLRSHLFILALSVAVPLLALAAFAATLLVRQERETMERDAIGRARAAMSAVESELRGHVETVKSLGSLSSLARGDLRAFYEEAQRALRSQEDWLNVGLASAGGVQLFDAVRPFDKPVPAGGDLETLRQVIETGKPAIGNVAAGPAIGTAAVRVRVPVVQDGAVRYVISVPLKPERFLAVLRAQRLPEDWVIVLVDRNQRFIARIPHAPPGNPISESFAAALAKAPEGWFLGRTIEGFQTYTPYITSDLNGWALGIGIPAAAVNASAQRAFAIMVAGLLVALLLAFGLAWAFGARIARPVAALAGARRLPLRHAASIDEVRWVRDALDERDQLVQREKAALSNADRAKNEFLAMLSHELRNPLTALAAAAEVLDRTAPDSEASGRARAVVKRQAQAMARLIEDLLDISRVATGKLELDRTRFDLAAAVSDLVEGWRQDGRFRRHRLAVDFAPAWIEADRQRIDQITINLLDNALKFTPEGREISIVVRQEGPRAVLRVADQGHGIAPQMLGEIFDLFVQGRQDLARSKGGMGIGLALVKRIAELHGGSASASSAGMGHGAVFEVRLPVGTPPKASLPAPPPVAAATLPRRRVLLIEDNEDSRRMVAAALATVGYDVEEAHDGNAGLETATRAACDVALIDIGLPDLDGYEVARRLRASKATRRMTLIALTGYGQPEDRRRARDAGFDAHLVKPVSAERLQEAIAARATTDAGMGER